MDVDADDVMYRKMGFTEQERQEAIKDRDGMAKAAGELTGPSSKRPSS